MKQPEDNHSQDPPTSYAFLARSKIPEDIQTALTQALEQITKLHSLDIDDEIPISSSFDPLWD